MQDDYETLVNLYDRLERRDSQRGRLLLYGVYFVGSIPLLILLLRLIIRTHLTGLLSLIVVLVTMTFIGLTLLGRYIRNRVEARSLEREISQMKVRLRQSPPKRKRGRRNDDKSRYIIGDDGEIIDLDADEPGLLRR